MFGRLAFGARGRARPPPFAPEFNVDWQYLCSLNQAPSERWDAANIELRGGGAGSRELHAPFW